MGSEAEITANNETAKTIRRMMSGHEVMTYRPKGGNRNYEHESMMMEMMMERLCVPTIENDVLSSNDKYAMEQGAEMDMDEKVEQSIHHLTSHKFAEHTLNNTSPPIAIEITDGIELKNIEVM